MRFHAFDLLEEVRLHISCLNRLRPSDLPPSRGTGPPSAPYHQRQSDRTAPPSHTDSPTQAATAPRLSGGGGGGASRLTVDEVGVGRLAEVHGRDARFRRELAHLEVGGLGEQQAHGQVTDGPQFLRSGGRGERGQHSYRDPADDGRRLSPHDIKGTTYLSHIGVPAVFLPNQNCQLTMNAGYNWKYDISKEGEK